MPVGDPPLGALDALRTSLVALGNAGSLHALGALRPRLATLRALLMLCALGPFGSDEMPRVLDARRTVSLALWARSLTAAPTASALYLGALAATPVAMLGGSGLAILVAAPVRPRACRGCDRKRCNARCEKHPGHEKSPSERQNGPFAAPFQRLNE
jgi:hypothetical protein